MAKVIFDAALKQIKFVRNDGSEVSFECHNDFFSKNGQHEALPNGTYSLNADTPPAENSPQYGTFYIATGDARGRDIHGGGSGLDDPYAGRQGWLGTYGCLRMQNEDGQVLSYLIIEAGNDVPMDVVNVDNSAAMLDGDGEQ